MNSVEHSPHPVTAIGVMHRSKDHVSEVVQVTVVGVVGTQVPVGLERVTDYVNAAFASAIGDVDLIAEYDTTSLRL